MHVEDFPEFVPGGFDLLDLRHVRHGAAGGQVGQHDTHPLAAALSQSLGSVGQNVSRLRHEMDAAENDPPAPGVRRGHLAQFIAVPPQVAQRDHLVLLIVMSQDQQLRTKLLPHGLMR